jgi:hypothetical protein
LQHVLPRGFHKVRYYGLWHHSKRPLSSRASLLLLLEKSTDAVGPVKIADLVEELSQPADGPFPGDAVHDLDRPSCPQCGSNRTRLLVECSRFGVP